MKTKISIFIFVLFSSLMFGQNHYTRIADKLFDKYGYVEAAVLYEKAIKQYENSSKQSDEYPKVLARLGDCYFFNSRAQLAADSYSKARQQSGTLDNLQLLRYAIALNSLATDENKKKAIEIFGLYAFAEDKGADYSMEKFLDRLENPEINNEFTVEVVNLEFNSPNSDFGSYIHDNKLYFASARKVQELDEDQNYIWNEQPFLDIYEVIVQGIGDDKVYGPVKKIAGDSINTIIAHEASVAITNDGKTMYFTRDNLKNIDRLKYNDDDTSTLELCRATNIDGRWIVTESDKSALDKINNDNYSTGSPALSPDNSRLYFVSDIKSPNTAEEGEPSHPDAKGQTDIYYVSLDSNGNLEDGVPINLGDEINTPGREMFPHITNDGILYFSSDGNYKNTLGYGLLDIYKTKLPVDEEISVENMGEPYNSDKDDFAIYIQPSQDSNATETYGYFSSNRIHPNGADMDDDIYSFKSVLNECKQTVQGVITDSETKEPINGALVQLFDGNDTIFNTQLDSIVVDATGAYSFEVDCDKSYILRGSKAEYPTSAVKTFSTDSERNKINYVDLELTPIPCLIETEPIFFDFDKAFVRKDAQESLIPVVNLLIKYPDLRIKIESHTDIRGSHAYNEDLSRRRADSTRAYLVGIEGIEDYQISSFLGFGERRLCVETDKINKLPTRAEREVAHQKNRRSYFIVDVPNCQDAATKDCEE